MSRKPKTALSKPTDADLLRVSARVHHDWNCVAASCLLMKALDEGTFVAPPPDVVPGGTFQNNAITSFAVHTRSLVQFFRRRGQGKPNDIFAGLYVPGDWRAILKARCPWPDAELEPFLAMVNHEIGHITQQSMDVYEHMWPLIAVYERLREHVLAFREHARRELLDEGWWTNMPADPTEPRMWVGNVRPLAQEDGS